MTGKNTGAGNLTGTPTNQLMRVLGKISNTGGLTFETLREVANTPGAAKAWVELAQTALERARTANAKAQEDREEERRQALLVTGDTLIIDLGLETGPEILFCRLAGGHQTVGELLRCAEIPAEHAAHFERHNRRGAVEWLRQRLVEQGGIKVGDLPVWLQNPPKANVA